MFIDVHYWVYFITTIDVDHSWISRSAPHIYARALEVIRSWETWDVFTNKDAGWSLKSAHFDGFLFLLNMEMIETVTNLGMDVVRNAKPGGLQLHEELLGPLYIFLKFGRRFTWGVGRPTNNQDITNKD